MTKPARGIYNTAMCVRCLKRKAVVHRGHVTTPTGRKVTAGWCALCSRKRDLGVFDGWRGHWSTRMNPR